MPGLCCNETYGAMTNNDDGDDNRDNNENEDGNNDSNAASGLESDYPIFHPITTPWSHLGIVEEDRVTTPTTMRLRHCMYLRFGIYLPHKYPIYAIVSMRHKLLYARIGVLDLCC